MRQIVIDTNVIIAALRSRRGASFRLLQLVGKGTFDVNLSTALLYEYEEIARRVASAFWAEPHRVDEMLDYLCAHGRKPKISFRWRPHLRDPDDDMLLELAVAAGADCIITHNTSDFGDCESLGVRVLTPLQFLTETGELP